MKQHIIIFGALLSIFSCLIQANVHSCVRATRQIAKLGSGAREDACMQCDPTIPYCRDGCQGMVEKVYYACDGVCLPDGYYFDPNHKLSGCWGENKGAMKIAVERCGCNSAFSTIANPRAVVLLLTAALVGLFMVIT